MVGCSSVPIDPKQVAKTINAIEPKKSAHTPSVKEPIAQKSLSSTSYQKPVKQELIKALDVKKEVKKHTVNFSIEKQSANNTSDNSKIGSGYITVVNSEKRGNIQQSQKITSTKDNKKLEPSSDSVVALKNKPIVKKINSNAASSNQPTNNRLSDNIRSSKKTSENVKAIKKVTIKNNLPKTTVAKAKSPIKKDTITSPPKDNFLDGHSVKTTLTEDINSEPYIVKLPAARKINNTEAELVVLDEDNLLKDDTREKSDVLVSIEVAQTDDTSGKKGLSNDDFSVVGIEHNVIDGQLVNDEKNASLNKTIGESSYDSLVDAEIQIENTIVEGDFKDEGINSSLKKSDFITFKEDVREKSDLLVSIEISPFAQVSDDYEKKFSGDNSIFDDVELDVIDKKALNEEENLFIVETTSELSNKFIASSEGKADSEIAKDTSADNNFKKSALLTVKDEVLESLVKEQDFKSEVFDIVKQANDIISVESKKSITDSLSDNIQQFLLHNWRLFVPSKAQYGNSKFSHCLRILDQMRDGQYEVQPPFKIDAFDANDWEQRLNGITFVQVSNVELELYAINENDITFNAVSTVFGTDEVLSTLLAGASDYDDQFFGLFAYSDSDEQSVGGAGRFYSIDKIKNLQVYLIKWDSQYYSLSIEKNSSHKVMEVIPLLSSQQQQQRNCRWRS